MGGGKEARPTEKLPTDREIATFVKPATNGNFLKISPANWEKIIAVIKAKKGTVTQYKNQVATLTTDNRKLTAANTKLSEDIANQGDYKAKYEALLSKKKKKGKSSSRKDEQNEDVKEAISSYVKDVLFRNVKFAFTGKSLNKATSLVWHGIKDKLKLDQGPNALSEAEFVDIYDTAVLSELSSRRTYVSQRCGVAAEGKNFV